MNPRVKVVGLILTSLFACIPGQGLADPTRDIIPDTSQVPAQPCGVAIPVASHYVNVYALPNLQYDQTEFSIAANPANFTRLLSSLRPRTEIREGMIQYTMKLENWSRDQAEREVDQQMTRLPAWLGKI